MRNVGDKYDRFNKKIIFENILNRVKNIFCCNLYSINFFLALNEYPISLLNYISGVVDLNENYLDELDNEIRKILGENKVHFKLANRLRIHLSIGINGRRLQICIRRVKLMLNNMYNYLQCGADDNVKKHYTAARGERS